MTETIRRRIGHLKSKTQGKSKLSGWVLPRETTSFADEGTWTNIDADVTPLERRTWSTSTVLGFWFSDALNAQGWEGPSSIIQLGLTWREAFYLRMKYLAAEKRMCLMMIWLMLV
jgi:NCS1 family nucleobase:cation symporter-1